MNNHYTHVPTPTLGVLETIGSPSSMDNRVLPHDPSDYSEGTNTCAGDEGPGSSLKSADHRSKLEFEVLAPGAADSGEEPDWHGISVVISCLSDEEGGYIVRGGFWPGGGFEGSEGEKQVDEFHKAFASLIDLPHNREKLHSLGAYESVRRYSQEALSYNSRRFIKRTGENHDPQLLASGDFAVHLRDMVGKSGLRQPEHGYDFFAVQPQFYAGCRYHRDRGSVNREKAEKSWKTKLTRPDGKITAERIVNDMIPVLQNNPSELLAAKWEYRGSSVALIPMKSEPPDPELKYRRETQARMRRNRRAKGSQSTLKSPSTTKAKAKDQCGSQNGPDTPQSPQASIPYLQGPSGTAPTMTYHPSNALHPPSLAALSRFPHYSQANSIGMSPLGNGPLPHESTPQIYHPFLSDVYSNNSSYQPQISRVSEQNQHYPHHAHSTSFPHHPEPGTSNHSFEPRPLAHQWDVSPLPQSSLSQFPPQQQTYQANSSRHLGQSLVSQPATAINPGGYLPDAPPNNPDATFTEAEIRLVYGLGDQGDGQAEYDPNSTFTQEAFAPRISPGDGNRPMFDNPWHNSMSRGG
jgi:hypothetical protein